METDDRHPMDELRDSMTRRSAPLVLAGMLVVTLAACGTADGGPVVAGGTATPTTSTGTTPAAPDPTDRPPPATAAAPVTSLPETTAPSEGSSTTAASTTVPIRCDGTDGPIETGSGRSVVLRTNGIAAPAPTILVIHGFTGTPTSAERVVGLTEVGNAAGVAVAYPEGTPVIPGGFGWNTGAAVFATRDVDDVGAIAEMVEAIVATGCVDPERVTIAGESNGAGMTLAALCAPGLAGVFRSAIMVIPAIDEGVIERCAGNGGPATPLAAVIGRIDTTAPIEGANGLLPQRAWFDEVAAWRGCAGVDERGALTPLVELAVGRGCDSCTEFFTVADGPHTWPGTEIGNGGSTPGTFDLNRRIVADVVAAEPGCLGDR